MISLHKILWLQIEESREILKLEREEWSIDTGRATAPERFSRWKNGGEELFSMNEMDDPFHDVPTSTLITPLERLSNDPETFRYLSAVQFNRRTTRRCPPRFSFRFVNGVLLSTITQAASSR